DGFGLRERSLDVARFEAGLEIEVGPSLVHARRVRGEGRGGVGPRVQGIELELAQLERVLGDVPRASDANRDRLADEADDGFPEQRSRRAVRVRELARADEGREAEVAGGPDGLDTRDAERLRDVERLDPRVRHRAAEEDRLERSVRSQIVDEAACS